MNFASFRRHGAIKLWPALFLALLAVLVLPGRFTLMAEVKPSMAEAQTHPSAAESNAVIGESFTSNHPVQPPNAVEPDQSTQRHLLAGLMGVLIVIAIAYGIYRRKLSAAQK